MSGKIVFAIALLGGAGLSGVIREKMATGTNYGSVHPALDMPVLPDMATAGSLKMDDLISRTYTFDQINTKVKEVLQSVKDGDTT